MNKFLMFAIFFANLIAFEAFAGSNTSIQLMSIKSGTQNLCTKAHSLGFSTCGQCFQFVPTAPNGTTITLSVQVTQGTATQIRAVPPTGWELPATNLSVTYQNCNNVPTNGICTITFVQSAFCNGVGCGTSTCRPVSITLNGVEAFTVLMQIAIL